MSTTTRRPKAAPAVEVGSYGYVSTTDTAKLVRWHLAQEFPGVKFSVRSSSYSGGSDVHVAWTDGPLEDEVRAAVRAYSGHGFDGMTDSTTFNKAWLFPDGRAYRFASGIGHSAGTVIRNEAGTRLPEDQARDYVAAVYVAAYGETTRHGYDPDSDAAKMGRADVASLTAQGARLVSFAGHVSTHRALSPELTARLESYVVFLAREHDGKPFDGNTRYDLAVPLPGPWEEYGSTLVYRLSRLAADELAGVLEREAARRAHNATVQFNREWRGNDGRVSGFYVTVRDGQRWGALLGPFGTREAAQADVPAGRKLAEAHNDRAIWYGYGVTRVTGKHGADLEAGTLEKLPERQLALAGLAA